MITAKEMRQKVICSNDEIAINQILESCEHAAKLGQYRYTVFAKPSRYVIETFELNGYKVEHSFYWNDYSEDQEYNSTTFSWEQ